MGQIMVYVVVCTIAVFGFAILLAQFLEYLQANKEIGFQDDDDDEGPPWKVDLTKVESNHKPITVGSSTFNKPQELPVADKRYRNDAEYRRKVDIVSAAKSYYVERINSVSETVKSLSTYNFTNNDDDSCRRSSDTHSTYYYDTSSSSNCDSGSSSSDSSSSCSTSD